MPIHKSEICEYQIQIRMLVYVVKMFITNIDFVKIYRSGAAVNLQSLTIFFSDQLFLKYEFKIKILN